jgi:hypothetical protein
VGGGGGDLCMRDSFNAKIFKNEMVMRQ